MIFFQKHDSSSAESDLRPWEHKPEKDLVKPRKRRAKEKSPKSRADKKKVCNFIRLEPTFILQRFPVGLVFPRPSGLYNTIYMVFFICVEQYMCESLEIRRRKFK